MGAVGSGWVREGLNWLESRFGPEGYRGLVGLFGNAALAWAAADGCLQTVLDPVVDVPGIGIHLEADLAVLSEGKLGVLEVKVHRKPTTDLGSQLDPLLADLDRTLRDEGVGAGVVHLFMGERPPEGGRSPPWVRMEFLPSHQRRGKEVAWDLLNWVLSR